MPKPIRTRSRTATHAEEVARRKLDRASRTPSRESRTRTILRVIGGQVTPTRHYTMFDGIRLRPSGLPRSRTWGRLPARNFLGEPRR